MTLRVTEKQSRESMPKKSENDVEDEVALGDANTNRDVRTVADIDDIQQNSEPENPTISELVAKNAIAHKAVDKAFDVKLRVFGETQVMGMTELSAWELNTVPQHQITNPLAQDRQIIAYNSALRALKTRDSKGARSTFDAAGFAQAFGTEEKVAQEMFQNLAGRGQSEWPDGLQRYCTKFDHDARAAAQEQTKSNPNASRSAAAAANYDPNARVEEEDRHREGGGKWKQQQQEVNNREFGGRQWHTASYRDDEDDEDRRSASLFPTGSQSLTSPPRHDTGGLAGSRPLPPTTIGGTKFRAQSFTEAMDSYAKHCEDNSEQQFQALPPAPGQSKDVTIFIPPGMDPNSPEAQRPENQVKCTVRQGRQPIYEPGSRVSCILPPEDRQNSEWIMEQYDQGKRTIVAGSERILNVAREANIGLVAQNPRTSVADYVRHRSESQGRVQMRNNTAPSHTPGRSQDQTQGAARR